MRGPIDIPFLGRFSENSCHRGIWKGLYVFDRIKKASTASVYDAFQLAAYHYVRLSISDLDRPTGRSIFWPDKKFMNFNEI